MVSGEAGEAGGSWEGEEDWEWVAEDTGNGGVLCVFCGGGGFDVC